MEDKGGRERVIEVCWTKNPSKEEVPDLDAAGHSERAGNAVTARLTYGALHAQYSQYQSDSIQALIATIPTPPLY